MARSEREIFEAEMTRERDSVKCNEDEAHEVLVLSYQARGLMRCNADRFVEHPAGDLEQFVRMLVQERLNTTEEALPTRLRIPTATRASLSHLLQTAHFRYPPRRVENSAALHPDSVGSGENGSRS